MTKFYVESRKIDATLIKLTTRTWCDGITDFYVTESHNVKLSSSYEQSNKLMSLNIEYPLLYGTRGSLI